MTSARIVSVALLGAVVFAGCVLLVTHLHLVSWVDGNMDCDHLRKELLLLADAIDTSNKLIHRTGTHLIKLANQLVWMLPSRGLVRLADSEGHVQAHIQTASNPIHTALLARYCQ
jgi:hypothetical protein